MKAFRWTKRFLIAALLAIALCWSSGVQAQGTPTNEPVGAWAYYTLPTSYTYPPGHLYYPYQTTEFQNAVFQRYLLENAPYSFGPVYGDTYPKMHIFSTYVYVKEEITLPIAFGGDDGSSLFVNGTFLGGHGFGEHQIYNGAWTNPARQPIGLTLRHPGETYDSIYINVTFRRGRNLLILAAHNAIAGYVWIIRVEEMGNPHPIKEDSRVLAISATPVQTGQAITRLENQINALVASGAIAPELQNSLMAKVKSAEEVLMKRHPNAPMVAVNILNALIRQIEAQRGKKISEAAANTLNKQANLVIVTLTE